MVIMNNLELAERIEKIAGMLEIRGDADVSAAAYRKAASALRTLDEQAWQIVKGEELPSIPGVEEPVARKIEELLNTGRMGLQEELEQEIPPGLVELLQIPGIGPKKAALVWQEAGVTSLDTLARAAREFRLQKLPGIGKALEEQVLAHVETLSTFKRLIHIKQARKIARGWLDWLARQEGVLQVSPAGSLRRWKITMDEIDLAASCDHPGRLISTFTSHHEVQQVVCREGHHASVILYNGLHLHLWTQPEGRFGNLLQHATGSRDHNNRLRAFAEQKGQSLSFDGLVGGDGRELACPNEESLYAALGLPYIPPELREGQGEIRAAVENRLPDLLETTDLRSDFHIHSNFSDGEGTIEQIARQAIRLGLHTIAITDHSFMMGARDGTWKEKLAAQKEEIRFVQQQVGDVVRILQGIEVNIRADGSLELPDFALEGLDLVVAGLHTSLQMPRAEMTGRILRAMHNPFVDILAHPSGRLFGMFDGADLDWDAIYNTAAKTGVCLEIDGHPSHLDMDSPHARQASERGLVLSVDTDTHALADQLLTEYGVSVARRGWVNKDQILNTWPREKLSEWLKTHRMNRVYMQEVDHA